jgi:hypothetical protein
MEARSLTRALCRVWRGAPALLMLLAGGCCEWGLTCESPRAPAPYIGPCCPGLAKEPCLEGPCPPPPDLTGIPRGP